MSDLSHHEALFNGLRFHYVEQGTGPLVLLLHGFPEFWYSWRFQLPALAAAGFRAVAPDLRGYNLSEKPAGVAAYHMDHLVADAAAMLRELGGSDGGYLVGHDWGGVIAWQVAHDHPELVQKLVVLNAPHLNRYLEVARETPAQLLKSYYGALFQLPWLPEQALTLADGLLLPTIFELSGMSGAKLTDEDAHHYREAIRQPGAATAALNYYRSQMRQLLAQRMQAPPCSVAAPTLLLWGLNDIALDPANAERDKLLRWVPDLRVEPLQASHWVQIDAPEEVNRHLLAFLQVGEKG